MQKAKRKKKQGVEAGVGARIGKRRIKGDGPRHSVFPADVVVGRISDNGSGSECAFVSPLPGE